MAYKYKIGLAPVTRAVTLFTVSVGNVEPGRLMFPPL